jgi:hypothetical protein
MHRSKRRLQPVFRKSMHKEERTRRGVKDVNGVAQYSAHQRQYLAEPRMLAVSKPFENHHLRGDDPCGSAGHPGDGRFLVLRSPRPAPRPHRAPNSPVAPSRSMPAPSASHGRAPHIRQPPERSAPPAKIHEIRTHASHRSSSLAASAADVMQSPEHYRPTSGGFAR